MNEKQHLAIMNAITEFDRKESTKRGYNPHALGHYCSAVGKVRQHCENGADLRIAILNCFLGRLCDRVLRSVELDKMTKEEAKFGAFPKLKELDNE